MFKVIFDGLTKAKVWGDDSQVFDLNARKLMKRDYTNIQSAGHAELEIYGEDD